MKRKTVLIVDDDQNDLDFIVRELKQSHPTCDITTLNDGVQALNYIKRSANCEKSENTIPYLIILDKKMPKMDGNELLKELRGMDVSKNIPVVVFSSSNYEIDLLESYESGANAYVVKPINIEEFRKKVNSIGNFWLSTNETIKN